MSFTQRNLRSFVTKNTVYFLGGLTVMRLLYHTVRLVSNILLMKVPGCTYSMGCGGYAKAPTPEGVEAWRGLGLVRTGVHR